MQLKFYLRFQLCLITWLVASVVFLPGQQVDYARVKLIAGPADLRSAAHAGVCLDHVQSHPQGVIGEFSAWELQQLTSLGLSFEVIHPDAPAWYLERYATTASGPRGPESAINPPAGFNLGSMGGCLTYNETLLELDSMFLNYPNLITERDSIGTTHEGRTIWMVKISDNPQQDEMEAEVLYVGLHHAREPMSLMNLIYYMQFLLEKYGADPMVTHLLNTREMYFVPILNPDGYVYNQATFPNGGGLWRKNRRDNGGGVYGVDLNRNYSYNWAYDNVGSSGDPNSPTYRGPSAFSEPETQAIRKFCMNRHFRASMSHHSWGESMMHPWGYDPDDVLLSEEQFHRYGLMLTESSHYVTGNASQTVGYLVNGGSDDWLYGEQTAKPAIMSFSAEIGNNSDWFWPQINRIIPLCDEMLEANLRIACLAGECVEVTPEVPCDLEGSQVWLPVRFSNHGMDSAGAFMAEFVSSDPHIVAVNQGLINVTGLPAGQSVLDSFRISLASGIPKGTMISGKVRTLFPNNVILEDSIHFSYGIPEVIFSEDGEGLLSQWTGGWVSTSEKAHTGNYSITDSPFAFYPPGTTQTISLQNPLDLGDFTHVRLKFFATWEVEANWDFVVVEASDNGLNYHPLPGRLTNPGSGNHQPSGEPVYDGNHFFWTMEKIDLSQFDGRELYLRFIISSNTVQERNGFFFDDLSITGFRTPVGLDPNAPFSDLHLYPNPASNEVRIGGKADVAGALSLQIFDLQGQEVLSTPVDGGQSLDLNGIPAGVYLYRFQSELAAGAMNKLILR